MSLVDITMLYQTISSVSFSLLFVALIVYIYWKQKVHLEMFFLSSMVRALIQLSIVAFFLAFIFSINNGILIFAIIGVMTVFSARTAAKRLAVIPNIFQTELVAQLTTVYAIMGFVSITGILPFNAVYLIPIGGMVLGNAMNISYLILNRMMSEMKNRQGELESALAMGASPMYALFHLQIAANAIRNGTTPVLNNLRNLGIVSIPGLMTGMIIGGVNPVIAAVYQVLIFFMIIFAGLMAGMITIYFAIRDIFDKNEHRLIIELET